jgi:hypothetical protein
MILKEQSQAPRHIGFNEIVLVLIGTLHKT